MKSWLKNILWFLLILGLFITMSFVRSSRDKVVMGYPKISIEIYEDQVFLTKDIIIERLVNLNLIGENKTYGEMDFHQIEEVLTEMDEIKEVNVFVYSGNKWEVKIKLRKAIARIFNLNGTSCYLDAEGYLMPLSSYYTAHVLTVNGYINEIDLTKNVQEVINNDSLKTIEILDDLYEISHYVCSDKFFSSQITHLYINSKSEFEMIPRVGDQRILFGNAENVSGKFKKLEVFYKEGMNKAGWEKYDTINIMYKNQIVCTKR